MPLAPHELRSYGEGKGRLVDFDGNAVPQTEVAGFGRVCLVRTVGGRGYEVGKDYPIACKDTSGKGSGFAATMRATRASGVLEVLNVSSRGMNYDVRCAPCHRRTTSIILCGPSSTSSQWTARGA